MFVHDLNQFATVQLLEETPAVPSPGKLCEHHGYSYGQNPRLTKDGKSIICKTDNFVPLVVSWSSTNSESVSSSTSPSRDSLRRDAEIASKKLVRPASSSSSGSLLERSDEIASRRLVRSPEAQNEKKKKTRKIRTTHWEIFLNGWRSSQMIWRTQNCMHTHTFLKTQIRNVLRKWYQNQGSTVFILTFKKTEIATSA